MSNAFYWFRFVFQGFIYHEKPAKSVISTCPYMRGKQANFNRYKTRTLQLYSHQPIQSLCKEFLKSIPIFVPIFFSHFCDFDAKKSEQFWRYAKTDITIVLLVTKYAESVYRLFSQRLYNTNDSKNKSMSEKIDKRSAVDGLRKR